MLGPMMKGVTVAQLAEAGVKRISTGSALARAALTALLRAGTELRDRGSFGWMADLAPGTDINKLLGTRCLRDRGATRVSRRLDESPHSPSLDSAPQ